MLKLKVKASKVFLTTVAQQHFECAVCPTRLFLLLLLLLLPTTLLLLLLPAAAASCSTVSISMEGKKCECLNEIVKNVFARLCVCLMFTRWLLNAKCQSICADYRLALNWQKLGKMAPPSRDYNKVTFCAAPKRATCCRQLLSSARQHTHTLTHSQLSFHTARPCFLPASVARAYTNLR